jgi:hypothetical protein
LRKPSIYLPLAMTAAVALGIAAAQAPAQAPSREVSAATPVRDDGVDPLARAAREVNLQETGHLHAVGEPGTTIIERGSATGTYNASIAVRLTIVSANKVIAMFTVRPKGGSVTGRGSARFAQQGANGYFGGTIAITGGTGGFGHASGTNIGISGVISRETFMLTVHVHGKIHV